MTPHETPRVGVLKFEALATACCDPRLARGDVAVLAVILQHVNTQTSIAWPGVNRIAAAAKLHRSNVMHAIKRLEGGGWIAVERGSRGLSNRYRPTLAGSSADATSSASTTSSAGTPQLVAPARLEVVAPARPEPRKSEPRKEPRRASRALDEQGFAEFWEAYPKKVEKVEALKAFRKLKATDRAAAIADVSRRNAGEWLGKDTQYLPGAPKYLRGRRWEDEPLGTAPTPPAAPRGSAVQRDFTQIDYFAGLEEVAA